MGQLWVPVGSMRTPKLKYPPPLEPIHGPPFPKCPAAWSAYDADFECELIIGHEGMHKDFSWGTNMWWEDDDEE